MCTLIFARLLAIALRPLDNRWPVTPFHRKECDMMTFYEIFALACVLYEYSMRWLRTPLQYALWTTTRRSPCSRRRFTTSWPSTRPTWRCGRSPPSGVLRMCGISFSSIVSACHWLPCQSRFTMSSPPLGRALLRARWSFRGTWWYCGILWSCRIFWLVEFCDLVKSYAQTWWVEQKCWCSVGW